MGTKDSFKYRISSLKNEKELLSFIEDCSYKLTDTDWYLITKHPKFTMDIALTYADKVHWESICTFRKLSEEEIERSIKYINWYEISAFQKLSIAFIKKYKDKLSLDAIMRTEKFSTNDRNEFLKLFSENDDPKHHKIWDENLQKSTMFCPMVFRSKYNDYPGARMDEEPKKSFGIVHGKISSDAKKKEKNTDKITKKNEKNIIKIDKDNKTKNTKTNKSIKNKESENTKSKQVVKKETTKKKTAKKSIDYSKLNKSQLKEILDQRKVKYLYHDTIEILRNKCKESE